MLKKVILAAFILVGSTLSALSFSSDASAKHVNGNITWYNGVGKKGSSGKKLGHWDCATKLGFDVPRNGTKIRAYAKAKPKKVITVYKNDVGRMPHAVLDVSPKAFKALGYPLSRGKVAGHYSY
ncbi:cell wall metabolism protein WalM [Bacillus tequilensis]|uniref:Cell wall metabolism protein WalM n=1 Tax=Bacillus tequilensis TaxID=227866 RepID=A0A6H0WHD1_9BACI|nr:cell wall metabolism protein WalM [Bacillus tequilensis]QIW78917.1 cell wall metabolism protein WalM [Bacillus tequilensis]